MKQGAETMQTFHTDENGYEGQNIMDVIMMILIYGGSTAIVLFVLWLIFG